MKPELEQFLTDRLDEITAEVVGEIATSVPAYTHMRAGTVLVLVRDALSGYLGARDRSAVLDSFRDLGASEARAGHEIHHFECAVRTGARVVVRRTASAAARIYPPTTEYVTVMETAFTAEGEIVEAAVDGHCEAMRPEMDRRLHALLNDD